MEVNLKGWIILHVLSHTEESAKLLDLEVEDKIDYDKLPFIANLVQISTISSIVLDTYDNMSTIYLDGQVANVKETPEEIIGLIGLDSVKPLIDFRNN